MTVQELVSGLTQATGNGEEINLPGHWVLERKAGGYFLKQTVWRSGFGELYYFVKEGRMDCIISSALDFGGCMNDNHWRTGNYFSTEREARNALPRIAQMISQQKLPVG